MDGANYKSILELDTYYPEWDDSSSASLYRNIKCKLNEHGFGRDMESLSSFLTKNPKFLSHCNYIQDGLDKHNAVIVLIDDAELLWDIHKFFPILYALNNTGQSVYKVAIKFLLDRIVDRKQNEEISKSLDKNLIVISNMFHGDNRLSAFSASLEGLFDPLIFKRKVVFTSHTIKSDFFDAAEDAMYKLRTFYSPSFAQTFETNVAPLFIKVRESKKSLWER